MIYLEEADPPQKSQCHVTINDILSLSRVVISITPYIFKLTFDILPHVFKHIDCMVRVFIFKIFFFWIKKLNLYFNSQKENLKSYNCDLKKRQLFENRGSITIVYCIQIQIYSAFNKYIAYLIKQKPHCNLSKIYSDQPFNQQNT